MYSDYHIQSACAALAVCQKQREKQKRRGKGNGAVWMFGICDLYDTEQPADGAGWETAKK